MAVSTILKFCSSRNHKPVKSNQILQQKEYFLPKLIPKVSKAFDEI